MKKYLLLSLFTCLILFLFGQNKLTSWNDSLYKEFSFSDFEKLDAIYKRIEIENIDYNLLNACVFYITNIQRIKYNRKPFEFSKSLSIAAKEHSMDMVNYNFYSHDSSVEGKKTVTDRLKLVGISNAFFAENIFDFSMKIPSYWTLAKGLVDGWMKSKGHRDNILNKEYNYLGTGTYYYYNEEWKDYFHVKSTQNFSSISGSLD